MAQTVAHHQPFHPPHHIISHYLVEDLLGDGHIGGFVFNHCEGDGPVVEDYSVGAPATTVLGYAHLVGHQSRRIGAMRDEEVDEMLSDPLLGRDCHEFLTQTIEDAPNAIGANR